MPAKSVKVNLINHPLSREEAGVTFDVDVDGGKFGELVVSKVAFERKQGSPPHALGRTR